MAKVNARQISRVVVTCDTSPLGEAALETAAALARGLDAELAGVFVENINLLRMAELPFAREFALTGAAARRVEPGNIERALKRQAEAVRSALSRAALGSSVPWSFQVVRGGLPGSVLEAIRESELAVFGYTGQFVWMPDGFRGHTSRYGDATIPKSPILTIFDESAASGRALAAASTLAQQHRSSLLVVLIADSGEAAAGLRARAQKVLAKAPVEVRYRTMACRDDTAIRRIADDSHAMALLWHGLSTNEDRKSLAVLVDVLKCPVILAT